jgi:hypothetical protein
MCFHHLFSYITIYSYNYINEIKFNNKNKPKQNLNHTKVTLQKSLDDNEGSFNQAKLRHE